MRKLPENEKRKYRITIRFTKEEYDRLKRQAGTKTPVSYIRQQLAN